MLADHQMARMPRAETLAAGLAAAATHGVLDPGELAVAVGAMVAVGHQVAAAETTMAVGLAGCQTQTRISHVHSIQPVAEVLLHHRVPHRVMWGTST